MRHATDMPEQAGGVALAGVTFIRNDRRIIDDLTLRLDERRIGLVGRNGSGKSTLARLIAGLIPADSGDVRVGGVDVARDRKAAIRIVGILFQNPDHQIIFPTVAEEIAFGLGQLGEGKAGSRAGALEMLSRFGCTDWADRPVHVLSQGQRHLVCLMAVLAMQPGLIVLDEPLSGLDIPTTRALTAYLDRLDQQIIHITHDPATLAGYGRVLWLDQGKIALDGAPDQVLPAYVAAMQGGQDDLADLAG
ncbi:MAG: energy-coupling factor ABC transporter ATP-binding protein [Rhodobacteraceae bacterium]|nr:energy-coupling factor ABC transporter ATP-binding protein [Paracoccaceae bacterium]